ncbi:copper resistance CopC family protein [Thalassiella azotivora]
MRPTRAPVHLPRPSHLPHAVRRPAPGPRATRFAVAWLTVAVLAVVSGALAPAAAAHNVLRSSDPADGATVPYAPEELTLVFDQDVLTVGAAVEVVGPQGPVTLADPVVDGQRVVQPLPEGLGAGDYGIRWRVTSADGHPVDGELGFRAADDAPGAGPAATAPGATTEPGAEPPVAADPQADATEDTTEGTAEDPAQGDAEDAAEQTGAAAGALPWLAALLVVAVGAGAAAWVLARRRRADTT